MAINGSDSAGDADRIVDGLEEYNFSPKFKEYILKEELIWSRREVVRFTAPYFGWVFWSQKDREVEPSFSLDNCPAFNPNVCAIPIVRDNIRHALQKLILSPKLIGHLVQFWAATTTSEGRTLLTTQYQPFALGLHEKKINGTDELYRTKLFEYRMKMCGEYKFYADAESGEEQLGLPGRVFLHQFPESTPDVYCYSKQEYPQRDLALRCRINESWAVPVFEHSSQTCVGVLEIVSEYVYMPSVWRDKSFHHHMYDSFQEFGLQWFDGYKIGEMHSREKIKEKGLTPAFQELKVVLMLVCKIHELPLAMTWVPCSSCDGLLRCQLWSKDGFSTGVEFCARMNSGLADFLEIGKCCHLRKGLVAGRALSSHSMIYCSDIAQLSVDEYPLVPYARLCKLSGWFTICLQNFYTGNDIYVLEFFLPTSSKDDKNIKTRLSFILGTMEEKFETFRLASGKALGELMSFEFISFQNDQKVHSLQLIQATRTFSSLNSDPSPMQSSDSVANTRPGFQDANMVSIKVKYAHDMIMFKLSFPYRLVELQQEVAKRLNLEAGTYNVCYEDELPELILIACDEDLQACVDTFISLGNTSTVVFLEPK